VFLSSVCQPHTKLPIMAAAMFRASSRLVGRCTSQPLAAVMAQRCQSNRAFDPSTASITFSPDMTQRAARNILENIDLVVCDMAGTVVQEGGLVYKILRQSMVDGGLNVTEAEMHPWHGAKKRQSLSTLLGMLASPTASWRIRLFK